MTTLLVSSDGAFGGRIAAALEGLDGDVMWCRGPSGEDCVCPAIRGKACPLTSGIDAVVIDTWLPNDPMGHGFRSKQLVAYYEGLGVPLVALTVAGPREGDRSFNDRTVVLPRRSSPVEIVAAVRSAIDLWPRGSVDRPA